MTDPSRLMVMSNASMTDQVYSNDFGTWNVTKALRDCQHGRHGAAYLFTTEEVWINNQAVDFNEARLAALRPVDLAVPLIFVVLDEKLLMIDGRHRLEHAHRQIWRTM